MAIFSRPCVPSVSASRAARLVKFAFPTHKASSHQHRLFKNSAAKSTSLAASGNVVGSETNSVKDKISVSMVMQDRALAKDLTKIFEVDHTLPTKSTIEIVRALSIYHLCAFPIFVRNGRALYNLSSAILGHKLTDGILKRTFFAHFCGGIDVLHTIRDRT